MANELPNWNLTKERILMWLGVMLIISQVVVEIVRPENFRSDFLLAGLALCGISLSQSAKKGE